MQIDRYHLFVNLLQILHFFSFPGIVRILFVFHIIQILLTERLIAVWLVSQLKSDCTFSGQKWLVVLLVSKGKTIKILNCKSFVVWREIAWARQRRIKYNVKAEEKISVWNRLHICLKILWTLSCKFLDIKCDWKWDIYYIKKEKLN